MRTLGLDTSSTATGVALVADGELLWTAIWTRPKSLSGLEALGDFQRWLARHIHYGGKADLVGERPRLASDPRPDRCFVEYDMVQRGGKTIRALARYEGVAIATCQQMDIDVRDTTPSHARKLALGVGCKKDRAAQLIAGIFPDHEGWNDDKGFNRADAAVLAVAAAKKPGPDWWQAPAKKKRPAAKRTG